MNRSRKGLFSVFGTNFQVFPFRKFGESFPPVRTDNRFGKRLGWRDLEERSRGFRELPGSAVIFASLSAAVLGLALATVRLPYSAAIWPQFRAVVLRSWQFGQRIQSLTSASGYGRSPFVGWGAPTRRFTHRSPAVRPKSVYRTVSGTGNKWPVIGDRAWKQFCVLARIKTVHIFQITQLPWIIVAVNGLSQLSNYSSLGTILPSLH